MDEGTIVGDPPMGDKKARKGHAGPSLTRRQLLAGTGKAALLAVMPLGCASEVNTPFADGTFWDDGSGWSA